MFWALSRKARSWLRLFAGVYLLVGLAIGNATAGTFQVFTERGVWEQAANAAGLTIATTGFEDPPVLFPDPPSTHLDATGRFVLAGVSFDILSGTYDPVLQRIVQQPDPLFDLGLNFHSIEPSVQLLGFGFDSIHPGNSVAFGDSDGLIRDHRFVSHIGFVGLLTSANIVPRLIGRSISIDQPPITSLDDFSVAVQPVPLPAALPLFAAGLGLLGLLGWRRKLTAS